MDLVRRKVFITFSRQPKFRYTCLPYIAASKVFASGVATRAGGDWGNTGENRMK